MAAAATSVSRIVFTGLDLRGAAQAGDVALVHQCLAQTEPELDVNEAGAQSGMTALHRAALGKTPRHLAILMGLAQDHAGRLDLPDVQGKTPLNYYFETAPTMSKRPDDKITQRLQELYLINRYGENEFNHLRESGHCFHFNPAGDFTLCESLAELDKIIASTAADPSLINITILSPGKS